MGELLSKCHQQAEEIEHLKRKLKRQQIELDRLRAEALARSQTGKNEAKKGVSIQTDAHKPACRWYAREHIPAHDALQFELEQREKEVVIEHAQESAPIAEKAQRARETKAAAKVVDGSAMVRYRMCCLMIRIFDIATHRVKHEELFMMQDCVTAWVSRLQGGYADKAKKVAFRWCFDKSIEKVNRDLRSCVAGLAINGAIEKGKHMLEKLQGKYDVLAHKLSLKTLSNMLLAWERGKYQRALAGWLAIMAEDAGKGDAEFDKDVAVNEAMKPAQEAVTKAQQVATEARSEIKVAAIIAMMKIMDAWKDGGRRNIVSRWYKNKNHGLLLRRGQAHGFMILYMMVVKAWRMTQTMICISHWRETPTWKMWHSTYAFAGSRRTTWRWPRTVK